MIRNFRPLALVIVGTLAAFSQAYQCPGKVCDLADLNSGDCSVLTEQYVAVPIDPTYVTPELTGVFGVAAACSTLSGTLTISNSWTLKDTVTVTASGTLAATVGGTLEGDIIKIVGASVTGSVTESGSLSWAWAGEGSTTATLSDAVNYPACEAATLTAQVYVASGVFTGSGVYCDTWDDPATGDCYQEWCDNTTASGYGKHMNTTVSYAVTTSGCSGVNGCP